MTSKPVALAVSSPVRDKATRLIRLTRGSREVIKSWYVGALTLYSLLLAPRANGWFNVAAVVGVLLLIPLVVVSVHLSRRSVSPTSALLLPSLEAEDELAHELERAAEESLSTWWDDTRHETRWFDGFFAFWWKAHGVKADAVELRLTEPGPRPSHYTGVRAADVRPAMPDKKKAMLLRASTFLSDVQPVIECAPIDYELSMWADRHGSDFRAANPRVSLYGVQGWRPYPALTCTHNLVTTSDGYVLLSLRNARTDFFPNSWSASFEEQIEVGVDQAGNQVDGTVGAAVRRGLKEELGLDSSDVASVQTLAVGRERYDGSGRSVRSGAIINHVALSIDLRDLWDCLDQPGHVPDLAESRGWMAVRFSRREEVIALLRSHSLKGDVRLSPDSLNAMPGVEVEAHGRYLSGLSTQGGHGWHPTSRARLLLWTESQWPARGASPAE